MEEAFTQTADYLAFTLPKTAVADIQGRIGGDWVEAPTGFRGYPIAYVSADGTGGVGKLGTGAPRCPAETHTDLTGGIVSQWPLEHLQEQLRWIFEQGGHVTRLDIALDDRLMAVSVPSVRAAVEAGQAVTRASCFKVIEDSNLRDGSSCGQTLYFGSPQSQTQLRVYDKRAELKRKGRADANEYGTRWELEFRKERAQACAKALCNLPVEDWKEFLVGLLRSYVDFRQVTREDTPWDKYRAPLLTWWEALTEGFKRCRLLLTKPQRTLEQVKQWFSQSMGPILAVLYFKGGMPYLEQCVNSGIDRWKGRHLQLLKPPPKSGRAYVLRSAET